MTVQEIIKKADSEMYRANLNENSSAEEIEKEKQKIYDKGGLMSFSLNTDFIHKDEEIEKDRRRCEKIDDRFKAWLVYLIVASVFMGLELYKFISVLISFIIWRE